MNPPATSSDKDRPAAGLPALRLDDYLPYRLNVLAQRVAEGLSHEYSETVGITIPEWRVMAMLGEIPEMTAKDIGLHSRMHKAKVSRTVVSLEEHGLLVRRANETDRREAFLSLTPRGRAIYQTIVPMALAYERKIVDGIDPRDLAALDRVIRHLMARLGPRGEPQDTGG
ncbi:MarR family winged helix-turn-helix transcriptional regulator [uncultured Alsobacter sp.]|uniref:MarR family winged helix-turn-helix transcriptional regulator n=1 Tax=uncultured Alsobacter sp. TaxID=1748258 RepID=UPI0025D60569|nr:MarR family transcriptional regulator [uncultured Alsobacter sp.]